MPQRKAAVKEEESCGVEWVTEVGFWSCSVNISVVFPILTFKSLVFTEKI